MIYRKNEIMRLCEGKNVLHLGYIHQSDYQALIDEDEWLHQAIFKVADKVYRH